ncbi:sprT-like domain-containing protein Spartan isoform X2 [Phalaenopsis equestris]|uniref:sprT-like domain-containing protein Spartan isoform X2 n=1 Tax=Phalaenopsis equestris TaxID=78828 RepID=UPI0009E2F6CD|nr:sprT-like domain-containing protein Spartan isoform X2 [Phalaenopsis equestris]
MVELLPDIQQLFRHYNALYFDDALGACNVGWSPLLRSNSSTCLYIEAYRCEIRLSKRLLRHISSADLKNSLLHEMIHAFLWIKQKNKNRSKHGPNFWALAKEINNSCKDDNQKPPNGYNISDQHTFNDEAETSAVHHWMCESYGHLAKREISRRPSLSECFEKTCHENDCGNLSCGCHRNSKLPFGQYNKIDIYDVGGKEKHVEGFQENNECEGSDSSNATKRKRRIQLAEGRKDNNNIKMQGKFTNVCSSMSHKTNCSENILTYQRTYRKKCNKSNIEKNKSYRRKREISLVIPWLGVYTDEESEEDEEPLINKRGVKRMKLKESKERSGQIGLTPEEVIYLD